MLRQSNCSCEADFLVFDIEVGVESLDEGITNDEGFSELGREVETHDSNDADLFSSLVDFEDVVFSGKAPLVSSNDEVKSGKVGDS